MFDSLLGRKFSAKCKVSIKRINSRVHLVRKKKQAMLNFLKKDVADLLANGHETNAFDRMEGLMSQMDHICCYDMIETYCQFILRELSTLQKQREECPADVLEAITTLIFAAARFSDLPELCDLRRVFTARFANAMEQQSINPEFVEKLSAKAFPKDRKLKLMQDIAQEFSVEWDSKDFGLKKVVVDAAATDVNGKEVSSHGLPLSSVKAAAAIGVVVARHEKSYPGGLAQEPLIARYIKNSVLVEHEEVLHSETKDIHVVMIQSSATNRELPSDHLKIHRRAALLDETENVEPENFDGIISPLSKTGISVPLKSRIKSGSLASQDGLAGRELKPSVEKLIDPPYYVRPMTTAFPPGGPGDEEVAAVKPVKPRGEDKPLINRAPPYVRPRATDEKADWVAERPELVSAEDDPAKPKPRSVRKHRRPQEGDHGHGEKGTAAAVTPDELVWQFPADEGRPRQGSCAVEHAYDEEEMALDMLLIKQSRRGQDDHNSKGPKKSDCGGGGGGRISSLQPNADEAVNTSPPARAASVPTEPPSLKEEMKEPVRAVSMQPAPGGRVHPRLPDYDELAARFNAMKKI